MTSVFTVELVTSTRTMMINRHRLFYRTAPSYVKLSENFKKPPRLSQQRTLADQNSLLKADKLLKKIFSDVSYSQKRGRIIEIFFHSVMARKN